MEKKKGLPKQERIYLRDEIELLFGSKTTLFLYPFKLIYRAIPYQEGIPCKFMVSVPKRKHKRAVHRNLLKRRTREAYRLHKELLQDAIVQRNATQTAHRKSVPQTYLLGFLYLSDSIKSYAYIQKALLALLKQLGDKLTAEAGEYKTTAEVATPEEQHEG